MQGEPQGDCLLVEEVGALSPLWKRLSVLFQKEEEESSSDPFGSNPWASGSVAQAQPRQAQAQPSLAQAQAQPSLAWPSSTAAASTTMATQSSSGGPVAAASKESADDLLAAVMDGDGGFYGSVARDGTCLDDQGVVVGYLNDHERTAGTAHGEYSGCVSATRGNECTIERPDGTVLATLNLGLCLLRTLSGSTVAEFRADGEVVGNLGNTICACLLYTSDAADE